MASAAQRSISTYTISRLGSDRLLDSQQPAAQHRHAHAQHLPGAAVAVKAYRLLEQLIERPHLFVVRVGRCVRAICLLAGRDVRHHAQVELVGMGEIQALVDAILTRAGQTELLRQTKQHALQTDGHLVPEHGYRFGQRSDDWLAHRLHLLRERGMRAMELPALKEACIWEDVVRIHRGLADDNVVRHEQR
jgi:hypothetical protein